jgi:hypothetical protein
MRLNEFADLKEYISTASDTEDFQQQLLLIWPDRWANVPASRRQPPSEPR